MEKNDKFFLPELPYGYKDLEPYISKEQLTIHHQKHHQAYVTGANAIFEKLENSRKDNTDIDVKSTLKELSFHVGGYILHSLFWKNLAPANQNKNPEGALAETLNKEFGSLEKFKKEFSQTALSVEGSGWAALTFEKELGKPLIMQIEKHNANIYPTLEIILVLDVWEHAYYLDYKNDRLKFIEAFWNIINWEEVNKRLEKIK